MFSPRVSLRKARLLPCTLGPACPRANDLVQGGGYRSHSPVKRVRALFGMLAGLNGAAGYLVHDSRSAAAARQGGNHAVTVYLVRVRDAFGIGMVLRPAAYGEDFRAVVPALAFTRARRAGHLGLLQFRRLAARRPDPHEVLAHDVAANRIIHGLLLPGAGSRAGRAG